jgi:hypothetical protein
MAKKVDPVKAKAKKQKIIAAVGGVILVGLLAFEVPSVMKQLNQKPPPTPSATAATSAPPTGTPTLAAPTLSGNEQASPTTATPSGSSLASGEIAPPAEQGQLTSFSRFASKDPFAQQMTGDTTGSSPSPSPSSPAGGSGASSSSQASSTGGSSPSSSGGSGGVTPLSVPSSSGGGGSSAPVPAPGSAVISVNGTLMSVTTGTDFPQATSADPSVQPVFHLLALTAHTAKITIVGGSYSNGAAAVTLHENKPLTLMNTANRTKYRLILKPQGTQVPGTAGTTGATPTVTLPTATP